MISTLKLNWTAIQPLLAIDESADSFREYMSSEHQNLTFSVEN